MINAFEEEIGIVNDVLLQQKRALVEFREYLNPSSFTTPSTARKMRFNFEKKGIERILEANREQLRNCAELKERAKVLAVQNVHLVETVQDDNGRAIFIFTFITVLFLPLSFIAGVFGMNLVGISDTTSTALHFWKIALPVTGSIIVLCATVIIWGESIWFGVAGLPRFCREMFRNKRKRKVT
jgi:Mg2+ and Co2+ transporter CorA